MFSSTLGYISLKSSKISFNLATSDVRLFPFGFVLTYKHGVSLKRYSELIVEQVKEIKLIGLFSLTALVMLSSRLSLNSLFSPLKSYFLIVFISFCDVFIFLTLFDNRKSPSLDEKGFLLEVI